MKQTTKMIIKNQKIKIKSCRFVSLCDIYLLIFFSKVFVQQIFQTVFLFSASIHASILLERTNRTVQAAVSHATDSSNYFVYICVKLMPFNVHVILYRQSLHTITTHKHNTACAQYERTDLCLQTKNKLKQKQGMCVQWSYSLLLKKNDEQLKYVRCGHAKIQNCRIFRTKKLMW